MAKAASDPGVTALNLIFYVPAAFGSIALGSHVLAVLWTWFVVPLGLPSIGLWHAAGLLAITALIQNGRPYMQMDGTELGPWIKAWMRLLVIVLGVLIVWGFGAIYHVLQGHTA